MASDSFRRPQVRPKGTLMDTECAKSPRPRPGSSYVSLNGQALFVPQDDSPALAPLIEQDWNCDELRLGAAETGYRTLSASGVGLNCTSGFWTAWPIGGEDH